MPAELPEHEERAIRQYVEGQNRNDEDPDDPDYKVVLVQKVASRRLLGRDHEIYDVHTPTDRWWVITEMTNLYTQADFPNFDMAFTFHVGLMLRLMERDQVEIEEEKEEELTAAWRRYGAAREAMDTAREAEDFQAIGVKCRESLIAFVRQHQQAEWLPTPTSPPKAADVKGWFTLFAQALATGRTRRYLSDVGGKAWDVMVGLQHDSNAAVWDAELALDIVAHVLGAFSTAIIKSKRQPPRRCPVCGSYLYVTDGDVVEHEGEDGWLSGEVCSACGHRGPQTFESWQDIDARITAHQDKRELEAADPAATPQ
jgi:hypothetical protein